MCFCATEGVTLSGVFMDEDCMLIALWRSPIKFGCRRGNTHMLRESLRQKDKAFIPFYFRGIFVTFAVLRFRNTALIFL